MNVLATGVTGYIGRNFCKYHGAVYRSVVRGEFYRGAPNIFHIDSLDSRTDWSGAFEGIDVIVHLAGLAHSVSFSKDDYIEVNTNGTIHLAAEAAAAGVKRFLFVSSVGVNAMATGNVPINELSPLCPSGDSAESKLLAEEGLKKIGEQAGMEVVIIRPVLVYGANAPGNFGQLKKLVEWSRFLPFGCINNRRSFVSLNNLSDFICACISHPKAGNEVFIISDGDAVSIGAFTSALGLAKKRAVIQIPVPVCFFRVSAWLMGRQHQIQQLVGNLEVDSSKARTLLGWIPPETLSEGMAAVFDGGLFRG